MHTRHFTEGKLGSGVHISTISTGPQPSRWKWWKPLLSRPPNPIVENNGGNNFRVGPQHNAGNGGNYSSVGTHNPPVEMMELTSVLASNTMVDMVEMTWEIVPNPFVEMMGMVELTSEFAPSRWKWWISLQSWYPISWCKWWKWWKYRYHMKMRLIPPC